MSIFSAEKEHGPGHAWLRLDLEAAAGWRIEIEREATKDLYLGPNGWQASRHLMAIAGAEGNKLLLGPDIVDFLRDGDLITYRLPDADIEATDYWPDVPISGRSRKRKSLLDIPDPKKNVVSKPVAPAPLTDTTEEMPDFLPNAPETDTKSALEIPEEPSSKQSGNRLKVIAIAALLLLWCGVGTLAWIYSEDLFNLLNGQSEQQAEQEDEQPQAPVAEQDNAEASSDAAAEVAATAPVQPVRDRAYWAEMLGNGELSGEALYNASQETRTDTELIDISQDFLRLSANKGHVDALKEYAGLFDPTKDVNLGIEAVKNPSTALDYYSRLNSAGDQQVRQDIDKLCTHLKPLYYSNADARIAIDDYCQ